MTIVGRCLCKAVEYKTTSDPVWAHNCHCSRCRSASGAAFASTLFISEDAFTFVKGEELLVRYKVPEAETFTHVFCSRCGSTLPFPTLIPGIIGIPMGSVSGNPNISPQAHIFVGSMAPWFHIADALPQSETGFEDLVSSAD